MGSWVVRESGSWAVRELGSWGVGELGSRGVGELGSWELGSRGVGESGFGEFRRNSERNRNFPARDSSLARGIRLSRAGFASRDLCFWEHFAARDLAGLFMGSPGSRVPLVQGFVSWRRQITAPPTL